MRFLKTVPLISLFISLLAFAEIREIKSMAEAGPFLTQDTLVIFDLDNTVFEPVQTLGSDQFFSHLVKKAEAQGVQNQVAVNMALAQSTPIQPVTKVRAVEAFTPLLVANLQRQKISVLALTARPPQWSQGTLQQVASLGINFSRTAPQMNSALFHNGFYTHGVLFLPAGAEKGKVLIQFLKQAHLNPSRVLFIDDKVHNVQSVDMALTQVKIKSLSLRYGAADAKVKSFNPALADFEHQYFLRYRLFLSDEAALQMMTPRRKVGELRPGKENDKVLLYF